MTKKVVRVGKRALGLLGIELLVPGGTIVVLTLLLTSGAFPALPRRLVALLPVLKRLKRL